MTNKYIELEDQIIDANDLARDYMCSCYDLGVEAALEYLDRNPDQAPGRTITESEFNWRTSGCSELETHWFKVGYFAAGGNIVADQEPSNAEKLRTDIDAFYGQSVAELADGHGLEHFLSKRGWTKAGGDDE